MHACIHTPSFLSFLSQHTNKGVWGEGRGALSKGCVCVCVCVWPFCFSFPLPFPILIQFILSIPFWPILLPPPLPSYTLPMPSLHPTQSKTLNQPALGSAGGWMNKWMDGWIPTCIINYLLLIGSNPVKSSNPPPLTPSLLCMMFVKIKGGGGIPIPMIPPLEAAPMEERKGLALTGHPPLPNYLFIYKY